MVPKVVAIFPLAIGTDLDLAAHLAEKHGPHPEELVIVAFVAVAAAPFGIVRVSDIGILDRPAIGTEGRIQALLCKGGVGSVGLNCTLVPD